MRYHQIVDISLVLKASSNVDMVMFFVICLLSFQTFPDNLSFPSAFVVPLNIQGGSGGHLGLPLGPPGAMRRHHIVDISLAFKASLHTDIVMFLVILYSSSHSLLKTDHSRRHFISAAATSTGDCTCWCMLLGVFMYMASSHVRGSCLPCDKIRYKLSLIPF